jgi:phospholipid/cholesterol/gamma-HCH transport system permease protein
MEAHAAEPPQSAWSGQDDRWTLRIAGDWRGQAAELPGLPASMRAGRLRIDAEDLGSWDSRLAALLWQRLSGIDRRQLTLELDALPPGLRQILVLALPEPAAAGSAPPPAAPPPPRRLWVTALGQRAHRVADDAQHTLEFFGNVLLSFGRLLRGRSAMRRSDLLWQIEQTGPRSVPIVSIVSFLVGLILAYMGAAQLQLFGAQVFIANLVTVAVVRETAALVTGIVLSGRIGAAFAAQIGSMRANEEIDALRTLGLDPIDHLVLPRALAMLLVAPLLTAYAALVGMAVGWLVAVGIYDVSPIEYFNKSLQALTLPHVLIGLLKGTVYAFLVALAGCRQGLSAGRSAQAVGEATTAAVVQSIVWIAVAASTLTVIFQRLDW